MTPELRDKLLHFCNDNEPFLTHNYMRMTDTDDGTATIVLPMHENSLNRWGGALAYGHPYGASGAEIMIHLMKILEREEGNLGVAAIPAAGGVGEAVLIHHVDEREWTEERERHTAFSIPLEVKL